MIYRHKKTQGLYRFLFEVTIESDLTKAIAYLSLQDGKIWVRPASEFFDGRFEVVE